MLFLVMLGSCNKQNIDAALPPDEKINNDLIALQKKYNITFKNQEFGLKQIRKRFKNAANWESKITEMSELHPHNHKGGSSGELPTGTSGTNDEDIIITNTPRGKWKLTVINDHASTQIFRLNGDQTILDCLEANGYAISNCEQAGASDACLMKLEQGSIDQGEQNFLNDCQLDAGYLLPCVAYVETDVTVKVIHNPDNSYYAPCGPIDEEDEDEDEPIYINDVTYCEPMYINDNSRNVMDNTNCKDISPAFYDNETAIPSRPFSPTWTVYQLVTGNGAVVGRGTSRASLNVIQNVDTKVWSFDYCKHVFGSFNNVSLAGTSTTSTVTSNIETNVDESILNTTPAQPLGLHLNQIARISMFLTTNYTSAGMPLVLARQRTINWRINQSTTEVTITAFP